MTRILFVCLGNICRSPMAEFLFRDLAEKAGRGGEFEVASAAVSDEEHGNPVYPPARRMLAAHGLDCSGKRARQITEADYAHYDLLIGMERSHAARMRARWHGDPEGKVATLLDHDIADPWYTDDFQTAWDEIYQGCAALLERL